jgi:dienelactone hydrolase
MPSVNARDDAPWKRRFRAWRVYGSSIAADNPGRGLVFSNRSGMNQAHAWDTASGEIRQLTQRPNGLAVAYLDPLGKHVYYLEDLAGNELGHIVRIRWEGGDPEDLTPEVPPYALGGMRVSRDGSRFGFTTATRDGFQTYVARFDAAGDPVAPRLIFHEARLSRGPLFSADASIAVMATCARTLSTDFSLVSLDTESGEVLAELFVPGASIGPARFSPVRGDSVMLCGSNETGNTRPLIWDAREQARLDLDPGDLPGEFYPVDWSPDGEHVLVQQVHAAVQQLYTWALADGTLTPIPHASATFANIYYRPDGAIVVEYQDSTTPGRVATLDAITGEIGQSLLQGEEAPPGRRWQSASFPSTDGATVQAWYATPEGAGPFPAVVDIHGGPTAATFDMWMPAAQAWLDHGFAFISVNYRGSTTFGHEFESCIRGDLGRREVDDVAAARDWFVAEGIARPDAVFPTGWSYGGYLTLLALGMRPDLWAGGMAGIAIADWTMMYEDQAETLRQYQVGLFGGTPAEKPEAHAKASPITYAERVEAPVLVVQGSNDTRCPARQLRAYEERLLELGKPIRVHWFEAGHGTYAVEQQVEHQQLMMEFACAVLSKLEG